MQSVTVVVPNYNHSAYLPRLYQSLKDQTLQPDEIVVVDDASTDDSLKVLRSFAAVMPHMRIVALDRNLGAIGAINRGLREASGDLVLLLAADDTIEPDMLERLATALEQHSQAALACGEAMLKLNNGTVLGIRPIILPAFQERFIAPHEMRSLLLGIDHIFVGTVTLYRRTLLMRAEGLDAGLGSLSDSFVARRLALEHGFVFVPRPLGTWYQIPQGFSRSVAATPNHQLRLIAKARALIEAERPGVYPDGYASLFERRIRFSAARLALTDDRLDLAMSFCGGDTIVRHCFSIATRLPVKVARLLGLAALTFRLQPFDAIALVRTFLWRRIRKLILSGRGARAISTYRPAGR